MKKMIMLAMVCLIVAMFSATAFASNSFSLGGLFISDNIANVKELFGQPKEVKPLDEFYTAFLFDGMTVVRALVEKENKEWLQTVTVKTSKFETELGIKVGDSKAAVMRAYPSLKSERNGNTVWYYVLQRETSLIFFFDGNDKVESITLSCTL